MARCTKPVLDCVVENSLAPSHLVGASNTVGFKFVPFAMEIMGRLGHEASCFLFELGDIAVPDGPVHKGAFVWSV